MGHIDIAIGREVSDGGKLINKPGFYGKFYEDLLSKYVDKEVVLVELGIGQGGSPQMFREYLGPKAMIYGIDVQEKALYEESQIKCFHGDSSKPETLKEIPINDIDVFIDDGSHVCQDVINAFEIFFPRLRSSGSYVIEDICTSYRPIDYGGGYRRPRATIEYFKELVDVLNIVEWREAIPNDDYLRMRMGSVFPSDVMIKFYDILDSVNFYNGTIMVRRK